MTDQPPYKVDPSKPLWNPDGTRCPVCGKWHLTTYALLVLKNTGHCAGCNTETHRESEQIEW